MNKTTFNKLSPEAQKKIIQIENRLSQIKREKESIDHLIKIKEGEYLL